ncbi:MAG TPA: bifunctional alpha,alpha-trehalose-phosphate synthase (UDP-forming)/trehalose-phosphatase [Thermodesulfobacteriota bacterium]|nr:bifunctional alpha,alpha-trehalose-phosphate synthase (UDP-forming)/trehalose-phosphatase [Thermodesulfobacteriota bacterium]
MSRLVVVSNRLPVTVTKKKGELRLKPSVGGLATGVGSLEMSLEQLWIGWPGITLGKEKSEKEEIETSLKSQDFYPIFLSKSDIEDYYYGFCNETIWPLFHYFLEFVMYNKSSWDTYKRVNEAFCDAVTGVANSDDIIWVHDYHLMLLPKLIKEKLPGTKIGFFLHIPFPTYEVFRLLPWSKEIIRGLLGADLIGFHTYDYGMYFLESVRRMEGIEHTLGQVTINGRVVKVDAFPMGIDYEKYSTATQNEAVQKKIEAKRRRVKDRKVILSIDRLDYTKGVPQRLEAFDTFLERNPEYKEKVTFVLVAAPSRTKVEHYKLLKQRVDNLVGQINGKHGTLGWVPVWYFFRSFGFDDLAALYFVADVALVTPLRDGMNLISKEFIATKNDGNGALVLSEMAGSAKELWEALIINPNDYEGISDALKKALDMPEEERKGRMAEMRERLRRYNVQRWANDFMDRLNQVGEIQKQATFRELSYEGREELIEIYRRSNSRLLLLDYDGTLMPIRQKPGSVQPDDELMNILRSLSKEQKNETVVISGRDKEDLEKWLGSLQISFVAEHGVWIKEKGRNWKTIEPLSSEWKKEIRPILELYVDRTPGSLIEEKDYSLVWHYRRVDPTLAAVRVGELKHLLLNITANLNVGVLEGNKVIEIKNAGINKGRTALKWVSSKDWDFILSCGDDRTDEDIFEVLPDTAYSIKVGYDLSKAKFNVPEQNDIRDLLTRLVSA